MSVVDINHARAVAAARAAGASDPEGLVTHMTEFIEGEIDKLVAGRLQAARQRIAASNTKMFVAGCAVGFGAHGLIRSILALS